MVSEIKTLAIAGCRIPAGVPVTLTDTLDEVGRPHCLTCGPLSDPHALSLDSADPGSPIRLLIRGEREIPSDVEFKAGETLSDGLVTVVGSRRNFDGTFNVRIRIDGGDIPRKGLHL